MKTPVMKDYLTTPKLLEVLDSIRSKSDAESLKAYAFHIAFILKLHDKDTSILAHYLETGIYEPLAAKTPVTIINWGKREVTPSKYPSKAFEWTINSLISPADDVHVGTGVSINLNDDTTQSELVEFIKANWPEIKSTLDSNFPHRLKRSTPILRLNDQLEVAEQMFLRDESVRIATLEADLAAAMNMQVSDVRKYAKRFKPLMKLKYSEN